MTKDCLVSVKGLQYTTEATEGDQRVETLNRAKYYKRNGKHYVTYEEVMDDTTQTIQSMLKFDEHTLEVMRKGAYGVHLNFIEGEKNYTNYTTPFGALMVGIETEAVSLRETEQELFVNIHYDMEMNYEPLAKCEIEISVKAL